MKLKEKIKEKLDSKFGKYKWYQPFISDYGFRTLITSIDGAFFSVVFAGFNTATAIRYSSLWYGSFAAYYIVLAIQRIITLLVYRRTVRMYFDEPVKSKRAKLKVYVANGAIFVPMDITLATVAGMMVLHGKPTSTGEIMAIATATYAFYKITMSIINLTKAKKVNDPLVQSLRNIGFVDALVSMLVLETTLISTFGELDGDMLQMVAWSGIAICAFLLGLGSFMIIKGMKRLNMSVKEKSDE